MAPKIAMEVHENEEDGDKAPNYGAGGCIMLSPDALDIMMDLLMVNKIHESSFISAGKDIS